MYDQNMGEKIYFVYILTNLHETTLYTGVTNDLIRRVEEHRRGEGGVFSRKYHLCRLVYYELFGDVRAAIAREKQIKRGPRSKKVELINSLNPEWRDIDLEKEQ